MFIAAAAEYFLRLDYFRGKAVTVHANVFTSARPDELRSNLKLLQVALLFNGVSAQSLHKLGHRSLRQTLDIVGSRK